MKDAPVLVTGANGYIASWLTRYLLEAWHAVHATVRDPNNPDKVNHLKAVAETAPGRLELFAADLFDDAAFDMAMAGCRVVLRDQCLATESRTRARAIPPATEPA